MAAITAKDQADKTVYIVKFTKLLQDPTINMKTITLDNTIVGTIAKYEMEGEAEITYWIDKKHWNKGIVTNALTNFLFIEKTRPISGRTAFDNFGLQSMLEKGGFKRTGTR